MADQTSINPKKKKRYRPIDHTRINAYLRQTSASVIPRSTRRLFFTFTDEPIEERGFYRADQLGGMGSGILLRWQRKYFLLTAYHVVAHILKEQQNEAPFFVLARSPAGTQVFELETLLYPRWHWDIRPLMKDADGKVSWKDVALVELFDPMCKVPDDEVIDLDQVRVMTPRELLDGQLLLGSGYPDAHNAYQYGDADAFGTGLAQATTVRRHHCVGFLRRGEDRDDYFFQPDDGATTHADLNGMSGGSVVDVHPKAARTRWAGMLKMVDEGMGMVQFIPAYALAAALRRYGEAARTPLDPNAGAPCNNITRKQRAEVQALLARLAALR